MRNTESRNWKTRLIVGVALASTLLATPVAAKKMRPIYPIEEIRSVAPGTRILALPPLVRFKTLPGANRAVADSANDLATWLQDLAVDGLTARGFDTISSAQDDDATRQLQTIADQYPLHVLAHPVHNADSLVSHHEGQLRFFQVAVEDMQVRPAHTAGPHL